MVGFLGILIRVCVGRRRRQFSPARPNQSVFEFDGEVAIVVFTTDVVARAVPDVFARENVAAPSQRSAGADPR